MMLDEPRKDRSHELASRFGVLGPDYRPHLLDLTQELRVEIEMRRQDGKPGLRHGGLLTGEMVGKLARDRLEKLRQLFVGGSCDIREHMLDRGVIAIHQWNAE